MIQTLFGSVEQEPNLLERLKAGIEKTRAGLTDKLEETFAGRKEIDAELIEELEYALITADIGVATTAEILESIRQRADRKQLGDAPSEAIDPRASAGSPGSGRAAGSPRHRAARRGDGSGREWRGQNHHHRQAGASL